MGSPKPEPVSAFPANAQGQPTAFVSHGQALNQIPTVSNVPKNSSSTPDIRLAWFYKPPATALDHLADQYDFFILTHNDEAARDHLKSLGVKGPILQYLLMSEIMDPGSCSAPPYNDQVAFKPGDYCWIQSNHPDWFLTESSGKIIGNGQYFVMDSGNSGWRDFWLQRASFLQENYGWEGVFLDNVEASLSKIAEWGEHPAAYADDASYQAAIESELRWLYTGYFHPKGLPVYANIIAIRDPQVWLRYLQYLDGAMLENFATGWSNDAGLSPAEWEQQLQMAEQAQALGKKVILVSQGSQFDSSRQEFALASYLLVSNGLAYFRYTNQNAYDEIWNYANQKTDLGQPLGQRYPVNQSWRRDFARGTVIVDPWTRTASITLR
ncbi:MAG: putative glycoside hydrolase [Anaerolineaceae bacterium]|nr:putative glycoside hydrolase [Anaerolineaceae bacterium]